MQQIELTTKLVLAIIGLTSISAILVPTYAAPTIKSADILDETIVSADLKDGAAVKSSDIVDGQVSTADLANDAVTTTKISDTNGVKSSDIVNGEVTSDDIKDATITSTDIAPGTIPPDSGAIQVSIHQVVGNSQPLPATASGINSATCPDGEFVTGGGFSAGSNIQVTNSRATDSEGNSDSGKQMVNWEVTAYNPGTTTQSVTPYVECLSQSQP